MENININKANRKYDKEYLDLFCKENNIILNTDYKTVKSKTIISGKCIHLDCDNTFSKSCYSLIKYNTPYCIEHNTIKTKEKIKKTCLERYNVENPFQSEYFKEKSKKTLLERYNIENPMHNETVKEKIKQTCLDRYDVENPFQSEEFKEKSKQTCFERYGEDHPLKCDYFKNKLKQTCLERYDVENPFQSEEFKEKSKQTLLERYNVLHPLHSSEIMEKSHTNSYKLKEYTFPSGNKIKYQGYEHFAFDELLRDGLQENEIINGCKNVPEIWYTDETGIKRKHYVDIYIPSQNRCIEVKSTWTAEKKKDYIFTKQKSGKELGYEYEIWIYGKNGNKVECYK